MTKVKLFKNPPHLFHLIIRLINKKNRPYKTLKVL